MVVRAPCLCGCGGIPTSFYAKHLPGHNARLKPKSSRIYWRCCACHKSFDKPKRYPQCSSCKRGMLTRRAIRAKEALGGKCIRCGILRPLVFDHIKDDGAVRRRAKGWGSATASVVITEREEISRIIATGQSDVLQLLCPNCNWLKQFDREEYDAEPTYGNR